jgi:hypothetical protein
MPLLLSSNGDRESSPQAPPCGYRRLATRVLTQVNIADHRTKNSAGGKEMDQEQTGLLSLFEHVSILT